MTMETSFSDTNEAVLFYGEKFRGDTLAQKYSNENINWLTLTRQLPNGSYESWKPELTALMFEKYTDENVYWFTWNDLVGTQFGLISGKTGTAPEIGSFRENVRAEQNIRWKTQPFNSEETWYWERIQTSTQVTRTYSINLPFPDKTGKPAVVRGELMAVLTNNSQTPDHHVRIGINHQSLPGVEFSWDGKSRFSFEFQISADLLFNGENQLYLTILPTVNLSSEEIYFDWFEVEYDRELRTSNNDINLDNELGSRNIYKVSGFIGDSPIVIDIANPKMPNIISDFSKMTNSFLVFLPQIYGSGTVSNLENNYSDYSINNKNTSSYSIVFEGNSTNYYCLDETKIREPEKIEYIEPESHFLLNLFLIMSLLHPRNLKMPQLSSPIIG